MNTLYTEGFGARLARPANEQDNFDYGFVGKNSEVFTRGDLVTQVAGVMEVATAADPILGIAQVSKGFNDTMTATNETVAKVEPAFTQVVHGNGVILRATAALTGLTGKYFTITGTTGAMQIDTASASATAGQFLLKKVNPNDDDFTSTVAGTGNFVGLFEIVKANNFIN